jgi:hypothetical protein
MMDIFQAIVNLQINGQGMFAPKLQPAGIPDSGGGGGGLFGWSFSGGGGWEHLDEMVTPSQKLLGGLRWGWDLSSSQFQSRLSGLGTVTLFSLEVPGGDRHHYATAPMDRLCTQFASRRLA